MCAFIFFPELSFIQAKNAINIINGRKNSFKCMRTFYNEMHTTFLECSHGMAEPTAAIKRPCVESWLELLRHPIS